MTAPRREYEDWTTEALRDFEERLYDDEVNGDADAWFIRDRVLQELAFRE